MLNAHVQILSVCSIWNVKNCSASDTWDIYHKNIYKYTRGLQPSKITYKISKSLRFR